MSIRLKDKCVSYETLIKSRSVWMGVATIWVMLFHLMFSVDSIPVVKYISGIGYGGVDIFLFASGIGCWHSLNKNSDHFQFLCRRAKRVLPTYYIFMIFWIILKIFTADITFREILGNLSCVGYIGRLPNQLSWYMTAILILYILAPYMYSFIDRNGGSGRKNIIFAFAVLILFTTVFFDTPLLMLFIRVPIYFLGMVCAAVGSRCKNISYKKIIILLSAMIVGVAALFITYCYFFDYLSLYGMHWYPFILITPGLCCLLSIIFGRKLGFIAKGISKIGGLSFELYLVHCVVLDLMKTYMSGFLSEHYYIWTLLFFVVSFIFSFILKELVSLAWKLFGYVKGRKNQGK